MRGHTVKRIIMKMQKEDIANHLTSHMACRVGIENWPGEAIAQWVKNYFGPRKLEFVITEAHDLFHKNLQKGR